MPRGRAVAALEPEPEPCGRRAAARRAGDSSSPAAPAAAAAMRSEAVAWPAVSSQAASLLEEAADLLVLHRDFAAAVEKCEAGCDSLGPGSGAAPERCGRAGRRWEVLAAVASARAAFRVQALSAFRFVVVCLFKRASLKQFRKLLGFLFFFWQGVRNFLRSNINITCVNGSSTAGPCCDFA